MSQLTEFLARVSPAKEDSADVTGDNFSVAFNFFPFLTQIPSSFSDQMAFSTP